MLEMIMKELSVTKKAVLEAQERVNLIHSNLPKIDRMIAEASHSYTF